MFCVPSITKLKLNLIDKQHKQNILFTGHTRYEMRLYHGSFNFHALIKMDSIARSVETTASA